MSRWERRHRSEICIQSINVMAESIGISNLPNDAAESLAIDVNCALKQMIQDAVKFMRHSKRRRLTCQDFGNSLDLKNMEPLSGFNISESEPFKVINGGGCELYIIEEDQIELSEFLSLPLPKLPVDTTLKTHWLCIDGVQPAIPENPAPVNKQQQKLQTIDPLSKLNGRNGQISKEKLNELQTTHLGDICVKRLAAHELSVEQQIFYTTVTESCVGMLETRRMEALRSLSSDPGLHQMLPALSLFICEGVKVNIVQHNMTNLNHLLRMVHSLMDNTTIYLEKYLHEIIPSVLSCIVSKQICSRPDLDDHWAVRNFASRLLAKISRTYNTTINAIQVRLTRTLSNALQNNKMPLVSHYGAIAALSELGQDVVKSFVIPRLKPEGDRIRTCLESIILNNFDKISAERIIVLISLKVAPVIKTMRQPPDDIEEYKNDFGYLGNVIHSAVTKARQPPVAPKPYSSVIIQSRQPAPVMAPQSALLGNSLSRQLNLPPSIIALTTPAKIPTTAQMKISSPTVTTETKPITLPNIKSVPTVVTSSSTTTNPISTHSLPGIKAVEPSTVVTRPTSSVISTTANVYAKSVPTLTTTMTQLTSQCVLAESRSAPSIVYANQSKSFIPQTVSTGRVNPMPSITKFTTTAGTFATTTVSSATQANPKIVLPVSYSKSEPKYLQKAPMLPNVKNSTVLPPSSTTVVSSETLNAITKALASQSVLPPNVKCVIVRQNQLPTTLTAATQSNPAISQTLSTHPKLPANVKYIVVNSNQVLKSLPGMTFPVPTSTTTSIPTTK